MRKSSLRDLSCVLLGVLLVAAVATGPISATEPAPLSPLSAKLVTLSLAPTSIAAGDTEIGPAVAEAHPARVVAPRLS